MLESVGRRALLTLALAATGVACAGGSAGDVPTAAAGSPPVASAGATAAAGSGETSDATGSTGATPAGSGVARSAPFASTTVTRPASPLAAASVAPTVPPTTGACGTPPPVPASAVSRSSLDVDVDGDGVADTVTGYAAASRPAAGDWHLRVDFASGGGSDLTLAGDPAPGVVRALGAAVVGIDDGRPVLFALTSSGASSRTVSLFRVEACVLTPMAGPDGGDAAFLVGAAVGHQEGLRCTSASGVALLEEIRSEREGDRFVVTRRLLARDGTTLVEAAPVSRTGADVAPAEAGSIVGCGEIAAVG